MLWLDKITKLGRVFLGIPMIVFGIQHFMYAEFVTTLVPGWIPGALFWTYFSGVALFCSGAGILLNILSRLAAGLLGSMIFIWILVLHIPRVFLYPENHTEFINVFNACLISGGALLYATSGEWPTDIGKAGSYGRWTGTFLIGVSLLVLGVEQITEGKLVFIVGAEHFPIPGSGLWSFLTGIVFIIAAAGMFTKRASEIAAWLGVFIIVIVSIFYVPQLFNTVWVGHTLATFLKGMAMSGAALILSRATQRLSVINNSFAAVK